MQQMTNHRPLAELDLLDDFLFNALLAYPEYGRRFCRKFLKILFGREFKNLNIVTQKSYGGRDTGLHGARLDVYIEEGDEVEIDSSNVSTIYDIEPDKNNKRKDIDFIAQRTRFYHAIIDSRSLKSGQSYDKLKKVFVIFICPYDPFGDDRMIYTIRNHCVENPELPYTVADAIGEQLIENRFIQLMSIYRSKKSKGELYKHAICKAQIIVSYVKGSTYFT